MASMPRRPARFPFVLLAAGCAAPALALAQQAMPDAPAGDAQGEIIVTGVRGTLLRALEVERASPTVINVVTADDIGNFADQNVAEALQRLPGVDIGRFQGEGRNIRIRGLADDYNQVTINGAQIGSSDGSGGRSVALDVISSELLAGIKVSKALTPDQDHDSLGGLVDLRTLSAFDRPANSARLRAEGSRNQQAGAWSPKLAGDMTLRLAGDTLGIAAAFNYFDREVLNLQLRNDASPFLLPVFRLPTGAFVLNPATPPSGAERFLRVEEADQRWNPGFRKRIGATLGLDYRPSDNHSWAASFIMGRLRDEDILLQQEVEFRRASRPQDIASLGPAIGNFRRVDFDRQIFFRTSIDRVIATNFVGEHKLDPWSISYRLDYSHSRFSQPNGLRGRFRERDAGATYEVSGNDARITIFPVGSNDASIPANYNFDSLLRTDEYRTDEILTYGLDIGRDISLGEQELRFQFGVKNRNRDKIIRRGEISIDPSTTANRLLLQQAGLPTNLSQLPLFEPESNFSSFGFFPEIGAARQAIFAAAELFGLDARNSGRVDYDSFEDVLAGYAMVQTDLTSRLGILAGARVERTKFVGRGTLSERISLDQTQISNTSTPLEASGRTYTYVLPSVHIRFEPDPQLLLRLVLARNLVRPRFEFTRALQVISVERETIGGSVQTVDRTLSGGNPQLRPLIADGADLVFGWYPDRNTSFTAVGFYKKLRNVFVETNFSGADVALAGLPVFNPQTGEGFTEADVAGNAGAGRMIGVELSGSHFFKWAPKPLDGLFVTANLTLIDGFTRSSFIRNNARFALPSQPPRVGNISAGYEDKWLTMRWSANYIAERLRSVNATDPERDTLRPEFFSMDVNLRVRPVPWLEAYFDAVNINNAKEQRVFRGDAAGPYFERIDEFGRTFQAGVTTRFTF